jgi:hypothetical protein
MKVAIRFSLAFLLLSTACFGAGRIKGKVVDKETNEPLVGANVFISGTSFGSATGTDGYYLILQVPPGVYKITARYVGYVSTTIEELRVFNDFTTETDFTLASEAVTLQAVVVTAERPLVNPTATNAVRITTFDQIEALPIRDVDEILSLLPGVNLQDGNIYIRGGRVDEVGYYLEGVSVTDPQYGGRGITIPSQALEEMSVQSAGYDAEFGRANSGIVQHQLRTGGSELKASIEYLTDNITFSSKDSWTQGKRRLGATWYGYNEFTGSVSTPFFTPTVKLFGLFHYLYQADRHPQPYPGATIGPVVDPGTRDSVNFTYPPGIRLGNAYQAYTGTGTLAVDFHPLLLRFSGSYTQARYSDGTNFWPGDDRSRIPEVNQWDWFGSIKATYFFTPKVFGEITGGWFGYSYNAYDPWLKHNFLAYGDSVANAEVGIVWVRKPGDAYAGRYTPPDWNWVYGYGFLSPGAPYSAYTKVRRSNYSFNAAFSAQVGQYHLLKFGGDYQHYTIRTYQLGGLGSLSGVIAQNEALPAGDPSKKTLERLMIEWGVNNYGYDVLGSPHESNDFLGPRHPVFASVYAQDRMEFSDLTLNIGLRYDYTNTAGWSPIDPTRPDLTRDAYTREIKPEGLRKTTPFQTISPRLGIAYPISNATVFHVQYAKLVQQSELRDINLGLYSGGVFSNSSTPIGFDLRPTRTTQYEIGFSQQLGEIASFDVTGYYKDIKDQIVVRPVETDRTSQYLSYSAYFNGDFATTKGIEIVFAMRRYKRLLVNASIGLQNAQGSGSFPNSNWGTIAAGTDTVFAPYYVSPLSYMNGVRGNVSFDYRFGRDEGGPILSELRASLLLTFNSGHPYTRVSNNSDEFYARNRSPIEALNSSTTPWVYQVDLRVDKTFRFGEQFSGTLSLFVINLFDTRNVQNVWARTGSAEDDGYLTNQELSGAMLDKYGQQWADIYRLIQLSYIKPNGTGGSFFTDPYLYGPPRQIRLGFRLDY